MDTSDPGISFDEKGVCNHCNYFDQYIGPALEAATQERLHQIVGDIKKAGKGKKYDVIVGLSGGADSSYAAYLSRQFDLRTLAIHLDNGWNSELAVHNIEKSVEWMKADLYTHVIDWEEFKSLQLAYLRASVIDIEALTDHAIKAILFKTAAKFNIKYFISGQNSVTESIMPVSFAYNKTDFKNIKSINKIFGTKKIKTFPYITIPELIYYRMTRSITTIKILDYFDYNREKAIAEMEREMGWKNYGGKHYESTFTKFYQAYILPKKFRVDKRRAHLSSMICAGKITREEALKALEKPLYDKEGELRDIDYIVKKFDLSHAEFEEIMQKPPVPHTAYPNHDGLINFLLSFTSSKNYVKSLQK
jgi:N-acetyl sugar amidotransferase